MPAYNAALAARSLWPQRRTKDAPGEVRGVRVRVDSHLVSSRVDVGDRYSRFACRRRQRIKPVRVPGVWEWRGAVRILDESFHRPLGKYLIG